MTSRRWRLLIWFLLGALGTGLLLAILYALLAGAHYSKSSDATTQAIRDTQVSNHELLTRIKNLANSIDDCTKPTGKCFKHGRRQTAAAVGSINKVGIATAACEVVLSRQNQSATAEQLTDQINNCVADTLDRLNRK